jgi:diguanylate cyclase (GGDEF)-like protein
MGIFTPISTLPIAAMGRFMPMYVGVDEDGRIRALGPSLRRVLGRPSPLGRSFFDVMAVRRPANIAKIDDLRRHSGVQLHLNLRAQPDVHLRGLAMPVGDGAMLINLSFGIGVIDAVRRYGLSAAHFAATDLTIELLYLVEAKAAVMAELGSLNARLNGQKLQAEEQALTDPLTGLRNRRALDVLLGVMLDQGAGFGLLHIDLDYFKTVNDTLGHGAGDFVLRQVAAILRRETRATDTVARVGGDEFVVVMPQVTAPRLMGQIARRIIAALSQPMIFEGQACQISASIGMVASDGYDLGDLAGMTADADAALYAAKRAGRGRAKFHSANLGARKAAG